MRLREKDSSKQAAHGYANHPLMCIMPQQRQARAIPVQGNRTAAKIRPPAHPAGWMVGAQCGNRHPNAPAAAQQVDAAAVLQPEKPVQCAAHALGGGVPVAPKRHDQLQEARLASVQHIHRGRAGKMFDEGEMENRVDSGQWALIAR